MKETENKHPTLTGEDVLQTGGQGNLSWEEMRRIQLYTEWGRRPRRGDGKTKGPRAE